MKRKNLISWIVTMLISLGTFAGALTAMGMLGVPTASTLAAPAQPSATPITSSASPSTSSSSNTPVSLASAPAGGGDDASFTTGSSSSLHVSGSDN